MEYLPPHHIEPPIAPIVWRAYPAYLGWDYQDGTPTPDPIKPNDRLYYFPLVVNGDGTETPPTNTPVPPTGTPSPTPTATDRPTPLPTPRPNPLDNMTARCAPDGLIEIDVPGYPEEVPGQKNVFIIWRGRDLSNAATPPYPQPYVITTESLPFTDLTSAVAGNYSYQIRSCIRPAVDGGSYNCSQDGSYFTSAIMTVSPCAKEPKNRASIGIGFGEDWVTNGGLAPGQVASFKHLGEIQKEGLVVLKPSFWINWYKAREFSMLEGGSQHLPMSWTVYQSDIDNPASLGELMADYARNWNPDTGFPPSFLFLNEPSEWSQGNVAPEVAARVIMTYSNAAHANGVLLGCCGEITHNGSNPNLAWLTSFFDAVFEKYHITNVNEVIDFLAIHLYDQNGLRSGWIVQSEQEFDEMLIQYDMALRNLEDRYPGISTLPIYITEMTVADAPTLAYIFEFMRYNDPEISRILSILLYGTNTEAFGGTGAIFTEPEYKDGEVTFSLTSVGIEYVQQRYSDLGIPVPPKLFDVIRVPVTPVPRNKESTKSFDKPPSKTRDSMVGNRLGSIYDASSRPNGSKHPFIPPLTTRQGFVMETSRKRRNNSKSWRR